MIDRFHGKNTNEKQLEEGFLDSNSVTSPRSTIANNC